jgi:hypothetical protein
MPESDVLAWVTFGKLVAVLVAVWIFGGLVRSLVQAWRFRVAKRLAEEHLRARRLEAQRQYDKAIEEERRHGAYDGRDGAA